MNSLLIFYILGFLPSMYIVFKVILPQSNDPNSFWNLDHIESKYGRRGSNAIALSTVGLAIILLSWLPLFTILCWELRRFLLRDKVIRKPGCNFILPKGHNKVAVILDPVVGPKTLIKNLNATHFREKVRLLEVIEFKSGRKDVLISLSELEFQFFDKGLTYFSESPNPYHRINSNPAISHNVLPEGVRFLSDLAKDKNLISLYPKRIWDYLDQEHKFLC